MAEFKPAFQIMITTEGGYVNDPQDPGGETYKGIARKVWSKWSGWQTIDMLKHQIGFPQTIEKDVILQKEVEDFYMIEFWDRMHLDAITSQEIANSIFDFGVNAGIGTSATLAQLVVEVTTDGIIGNNTIAAINNFNVDHFIAAFTVAKIARYVTIVKKRPTSRKYFYGWILRALGETA